MNQSEMKEFFLWCEENLKGFKQVDADESVHFYLNEECIGGWAGDRQEFFYEQSDKLAAALRMMDAEKRDGSDMSMSY